jgi:adenylate kinase family enzyme
MKRSRKTDVEYWHPNWEKPTKEVWIKQLTELLSKEQWIIDGNHTDTMELRYKAADLVIFLDINRLICLAGVFQRYGKKRSDMPDYLEERWDSAFIKLLKGLWDFSKTRKRIILDLHSKYPDKPFFVIENRRKMNHLLKLWRDEKRSKS